MEKINIDTKMVKFEELVKGSENVKAYFTGPAGLLGDMGKEHPGTVGSTICLEMPLEGGFIMYDVLSSISPTVRDKDGGLLDVDWTDIYIPDYVKEDLFLLAGISSPFIKTDDAQWARKVSDHCYELIEARDEGAVTGLIDLGDYGDEEINDIISLYYGSPDNFMGDYLDAGVRERLIAEMVFESTNVSELSYFQDMKIPSPGLDDCEMELFILQLANKIGEKEKDEYKGFVKKI